MEFAGFTLFPSHMRRTIAHPEEQRVVGEALERFGLIDQLPPHKKLRVELENAVPPGIELWRAHETWTQGYFPDVATPDGFPRQDAAALTPPGIVKVSVERINRETPGMGSHSGFEGLYLSVLVSISDSTVWDVRGEGSTTRGRLSGTAIPSGTTLFTLSFMRGYPGRAVSCTTWGPSAA